ncbi:MAG: SgcJ/EcaC family oxidoreductase, partial [Acidobacteriaceae bacterium]|nr:SgcJ/EcaC family oxidoreductase [Acidobacteriaceae bacterium]
MRFVPRCALLLVFTCGAALSAADTESQIKTVLDDQIEDWNRGDIPAFVTTYADDCIFVGKQVAHGRDQVLARYEKTYPTRQAMGHLTFSALEVHALSDDIA